MKSFTIALCQIIPTYNKTETVRHALDMVEDAACNGASLIALPEMFYHPFELQSLRDISGDEDQILKKFKKLAKQKNIFISTGSMAVQENDKLFNRSYLLGPDGGELYTYDKCFLFDVKFKQLLVKESAFFSAGDRAAVAETDLGRIGTIICYDIRFPESARAAAIGGVELLLVPAVFNQITGPAHWEIVMRARAIENQVFLAAISQGRNQSSSYKAHGHSMVISPWGDILAEAGQGEEIIYADLDAKILEETRNRLPLLKHRRNIT